MLLLHGYAKHDVVVHDGALNAAIAIVQSFAKAMYHLLGGGRVLPLEPWPDFNCRHKFAVVVGLALRRFGFA
jgi:hypothetical protein